MKNLTESATYTANVSVPEDNVDLRTAASVETAFQALANRTKYLKDGFDASTAQKVTQKIVPLSSMEQMYGGLGATKAGTAQIAEDIVSGVYRYPLQVDTSQQAIIPLNPYLPHGSTLTQVDVMHSQIAAGTPGSRETLIVQALRFAFGSPGITAQFRSSQEVNGTTATTSAPKITSVTGLSYVIDRTQDSQELVISAGSAPGGCLWYAIRLTYTTAG